MHLLTVDEVAEHYGVPVSTVRRWCGDGTLPASKHGRQWLVDRDKLPSRPPRKRAPASTAARAKSSRRRSHDILTALRHVRSTDLREVWVPDIVRFGDLDRDTGLTDRVAARLESATFDPPVEVPIPKTPFFTRSAVVLSIEDRVAFQAVAESLAAEVERRTIRTVYSARIPAKPGNYFFARKGTDAWLEWRKAVRREVLSLETPFVIKTDLTAYFDTISHDLLVADVQALGAPTETLGILRAMLRSWALVPNQGLPQGPNASRLLGNLFLQPVDRAMEDAGYRYFRYLDDVRIVGETRAEVATAIRLFERECRTRGLLVSSAKTQLVHGERAKADALDDDERTMAQYLIDSGQIPKARHELKRILRNALQDEDKIDVRSSRFALWRLTLLRESSMLRAVLRNLENLAPVASVAMTYLRPFVGRDSVVNGVRDYLADGSRASSPYMVSWVVALMLDHPGPMPESWLASVRRICRDRNNPVFLRAIAVNVLARGREASDVHWLKAEIAREADHEMLRGLSVALFRVGALDKATIRTVRSRGQRLSALMDYLTGRESLPSLLYSDRSNLVGK